MVRIRERNAKGFKWFLTLGASSGDISYPIWETSSGAQMCVFSQDAFLFKPRSFIFNQRRPFQLLFSVLSYLSVHPLLPPNFSHICPRSLAISICWLCHWSRHLWKLGMLFLVITMIISKPGTFRNKRHPWDGNLRGCFLLIVSFKLVEGKCITSCISPIWTELCWFSTNFP